MSSVFIKKSGEFLPRFLLLAPYELASLAGPPSVNALLVHNLANLHGILFGGDPLADVDVVNSLTEPDAEVAFAAHLAVQDAGNFFGGFGFDAGDADLPASFVFYDFTIAESQAFIVLDVADGADIDSTISDVFHNLFSFLFSGLSSLLLS